MGFKLFERSFGLPDDRIPIYTDLLQIEGAEVRIVLVINGTTLQFINAYEYFELRFQSTVLRNIATLLFTFNTLVYLAVVIYAPAIALTGRLG